MTLNEFIDTAAKISAIATPFLLLIFSAIGWRVKTAVERRSKLEENLREDRIGIYDALLKPIFILFSPEKAWKGNKEERAKAFQEKMSALEYHRNAFRLSLIGSDNVVKAFNNMMQNFYNNAGNLSDTKQTVDWLMLNGTLLLEIRKSMGNKNTSLETWDMLEWFVKEARQLRSFKT